MNGPNPVILLNDRYELGELLGHGGMGKVYRARDVLLDRGVAVKILSETDLADESRERMLREAKAIAKLNHPNIVQIHDAGALPATHDPAIGGSGRTIPYIVMELVEGANLHDRPPHGFHSIVQVGRQICASLEHAHSQGIIHRDLKPENVLIGPDGTAKLMDFGLARSGGSRITTEGKLTGTVFYLAPEVALGSQIDGRADLYSLGVMLYEMVTGELPFTAGDPLAVVTQHLHAPVVSPRARRADVPLVLEALIVELLAKSPNDRPASAAELGRRLATVESIVSVWDIYEPPEGATSPAGLAGWFSLLRRQRKANRRIIRKQAARAGLGAAVGLALFGATRPLQVALGAAVNYQETLKLVSLPTWILLGAFAMGMAGGAQGLASGMLVGYADAFATSRSYSVQRLLLASLAGLAHAAILVLFPLLGLFPAPAVRPTVYIPLFVLFGLFLGAALSYVIPVLGTTRSTAKQLKTSTWVTLLLWAAALPLVYLTYEEYTSLMLLFGLGFAPFLVFGLGLALSDRGRRSASATA